MTVRWPWGDRGMTVLRGDFMRFYAGNGGAASKKRAYAQIISFLILAIFQKVVSENSDLRAMTRNEKKNNGLNNVK